MTRALKHGAIAVLVLFVAGLVPPLSVFAVSILAIPGGLVAGLLVPQPSHGGTGLEAALSIGIMLLVDIAVYGLLIAGLQRILGFHRHTKSTSR